MLTWVRLKDPFIGFNEIEAEWVGTKSWTYHTKFQSPPAPAGSRYVLAFDGLDTFAHVKLGKNIILEADNMFLPYRVDITHLLGNAGEHDLQVEFDSPMLKAQELKAAHPDHKWICFNGDSARLAARKAQYHWGWDWGPRLLCAGIWRPVRLEVFSARVADIRTDIELSTDLQSASIRVSAEVESDILHDIQVQFTLRLGGINISTASTSVSLDGRASSHFEVAQPSLWMPAGYGSQPLYHIDATISCHGIVLHSDSRRFGIRKVELIQEPDIHGRSFYFRLNGVDVFCGGSCWIPADSFITNITSERYREWLKLMIPANQKMIRLVYMLPSLHSFVLLTC